MKITLKTELGFTVLSLLMLCFLLCLQAGCATHPPNSSALHRLQGTWGGVWWVQATPGGPLVKDAGANNATITITGNSLYYYRDPDFWFETTFTLPAGTDPQQLHATIIHSSDPSPTKVISVVAAIFKIEHGTLTLALNQFDAEHPPGSFEPPKSSEEHKAMTRYELRKVQPQKKNAELLITDN